MESFEKQGEQVRPVAVVRDIISEYETRPERPKGHIVSRYIAETEPDVFAAISAETGLTNAELWSYIEDEERKASRPFAAEVTHPPASTRNTVRRADTEDSL